MEPAAIKIARAGLDDLEPCTGVPLERLPPAFPVVASQRLDGAAARLLGLVDHRPKEIGRPVFRPCEMERFEDEAAEAPGLGETQQRRDHRAVTVPPQRRAP